MARIFISYRREDSEDVSGRIHDRLAQHFGDDAIFTDVDSIPFGVDFRDYIDKQVGHCEVFLVVIGRDWLSVTAVDGRPRLEHPEDFVRLEIESALFRDIPVIPLLVRRATMPASDDLPPSLEKLAFRNGTPIRPNPDFRRDIDRLIKGIEHHLMGRGERKLANDDKKRRRDASAEEAGVVENAGRRRAGAKPKNTKKERKRRIINIPATPRPGDDAVEPLTVFRDRLKIGCEGPEMVVIPEGSFIMGPARGEEGRDKSHEGPCHTVSFEKPFAIGKYAVTIDEYDQFAEATNRKLPWNLNKTSPGKYPVYNLLWKEAAAFTEWLSGETGKRFRLPSEAEWEYAARAGTEGPFSFDGPINADKANYCAEYIYGGSAKGKYREKPVPVGSLPPNPWGLYEVHGNVKEHIQDYWHSNYRGAPDDGSAWLDERKTIFSRARVVRGGAFCSKPARIRSAARSYTRERTRGSFCGFRLARDL